MNNNITERDLMIGDWVYYKDKKQIACRVISIIGNYIRFDNGTPQDWMSDVKNFTPIPITAEVLEKNGFEYKEADETCATEAFHHWHLDGSRFAIDDDSWWRSVKDGELHVKFGGFPLKYLHELQHALRLAGIDKEITI